jgi:hypothetical protein
MLVFMTFVDGPASLEEAAASIQALPSGEGASDRAGICRGSPLQEVVESGGGCGEDKETQRQHH